MRALLEELPPDAVEQVNLHNAKYPPNKYPPNVACRVCVILFKTYFGAERNPGILRSYYPLFLQFLCELKRGTLSDVT